MEAAIIRAVAPESSSRSLFPTMIQQQSHYLGLPSNAASCSGVAPFWFCAADPRAVIQQELHHLFLSLERRHHLNSSSRFTARPIYLSSRFPTIFGDFVCPRMLPHSIASSAIRWESFSFWPRRSQSGYRYGVLIVQRDIETAFGRSGRAQHISAPASNKGRINPEIRACRPHVGRPDHPPDVHISHSADGAATPLPPCLAIWSTALSSGVLPVKI